MTPFALPPDGEIFIDQVLERCRNLINSGIWAGINHERLGVWMKNYKTPTERYFGACVLDALIYRSDEQTFAMMEQLFQRVIPDLLRLNPPKVSSDTQWTQKLCEPFRMDDPQVRIVPVLKGDDPPTKSGLALARFYKRHLSFNPAWMLWPWQIHRAVDVGISQFLFVDDFLGTGEQFTEFAQQFSLNEYLEGCYAIYAPLVAHSSGIKELAKNIPGIHVVAVEEIDETYSLFSRDSNWFTDETNSADQAKEFYDGLVSRVQFPVKPEAIRGYGKLGLAYAFQHAIPDNCLPILWAEGNNWKPLIER